MPLEFNKITHKGMSRLASTFILWYSESFEQRINLMYNTYLYLSPFCKTLGEQLVGFSTGVMYKMNGATIFGFSSQVINSN